MAKRSSSGDSREIMRSSSSCSITRAYYHGNMEVEAALTAFLEDPGISALAELGDALADWPPAAAMVKMAARAVYLEDERLEQLLESAVREARHLLQEAET